jgi:hypothetical protein
VVLAARTVKTTVLGQNKLAPCEEVSTRGAIRCPKSLKHKVEHEEIPMRCVNTMGVQNWGSLLPAKWGLAKAGRGGLDVWRGNDTTAAGTVGANVPKWRKAEFHSAFQGKQQELTSDG